MKTKESTQTWKPDTCGCALKQTRVHQIPEPGDAQTEEIITIDHARTEVLKTCAAHALVESKELPEVVRVHENQRKNIAIRLAMEESDDLPEWEFTGQGKSRALRLRSRGRLNSGKRMRVQEKLDAQFGTGTVQIED